MGPRGVPSKYWHVGMQWLQEFNYMFWISVQVVSSSKQQLKKKNRFQLCFSKLTQNRVVKKFKQGKQKIYIDELMDETMKMKSEKHTGAFTIKCSNIFVL